MSLATPCANHHLPSGSVERTTASNDCQHTARHSQVCFQRPHTSLWHRARRCGIVRVVVASCIIARSYTSHFHAAATDRRQQVEGERPRCSGGARDFCRCQLVRTSTSRSKPSELLRSRCSWQRRKDVLGQDTALIKTHKLEVTGMVAAEHALAVSASTSVHTQHPLLYSA